MATLLPAPESRGSSRAAAFAAGGRRNSHAASVSYAAPAPPSLAMAPMSLRRVSGIVVSNDLMTPLARRPRTDRRLGYFERKTLMPPGLNSWTNHQLSMLRLFQT